MIVIGRGVRTLSAERAQDEAGESQHRVLEETGHWLHLERAEEVAAAVQWCVERARVRAGVSDAS